MGRHFVPFVFCICILIWFGESATEFVTDLLDNGPVDQCKDVLGGKCYCTDLVVDCKGAAFTDINTIQPYLKNTTVRVSITNGMLTTLSNGVFQLDSSITYLNLSGNPLRLTEGFDFSALKNLETLDLSPLEPIDNPSVNLSLSISLLKRLKHLTLRQVLNEGHPEYLLDLSALPKLQTLDLSSNGLRTLDPNWIAKAKDNFHLVSLNFSNNQFGRPPISEVLTNLEVLDISNNKIEYLTGIEIEIFEKYMNLKKGYLHGNIWSCDCVLGPMVFWLNKTQLPLDFEEIRCHTSYVDSYIGKVIKGLDFHSMCEPTVVICGGPYPVAVAKTTFIIIAAVGVLILTGGAVTVLVCYRRRKNGRSPPPSRIIDDSPKSPGYNRIL